MSLIFPSNPTVGQTYQSGSSGTFVYNGEAWDSQNSNLPVTVATASYTAYQDRDVMMLTVSTAITPTLNNTILFDTVSTNRGGLSMNSGVITGFKPNKLYEISAVLGVYVASGDTFMNYQWYLNNSTLVGTTGYAVTVNRTTARSSQPQALYLSNSLNAANLRLRCTGTSAAIIDNTMSWIYIKEI